MSIPLRVLILEDKLSDAELSVIELRKSGFAPDWQRVETESDYVNHLDSALDLILADYSLPQFDGLRALQLLQQRGLDIPFILISGTVGEDVAVEAMKQGAADYLLKDRLTRLGPAVKSALEQKRLRDERKLAEAALRETESQLRAVLNNAPITIFTTDSHGIFTLSEGKGLEHVGLKPGENVGVSAFDLYGSFPFAEYSGKVTAGEDVIRRVLAGKEVTAVSKLHGVYFDNHIGPLRDTDGKVIGIVGVAIDITERRQAEEAMRRAEENYRNIFENSLNGIFQSTPDGRFILVNPALARMWGYDSPEDLLASVTDTARQVYVDPDCRAEHTRLLKEQGGSVIGFEYQAYRKDGTTIWVSENVNSVVDANGNLRYYEGVVEDISERKQAEAALREANQRAIREYEQLLERLAQLAQTVGTARDLASIFRGLREFAEISVPCNGLFVSLYNPERQERICVYSGGDGEEDDVSTLPPLPMNDSPQSQAIATAQIVVTDDFQAAVAGKPVVTLGMEQDPRMPQSSLAVPMTVLGRVIGAFEVQSVEPAAYKPEHVTAMHMAANLAAIATENVQMLERERQLRLTTEMSEERYRTLAEAARDAIFIVNRDDHIEYVNSFAAGQFGSRAEELIGRTRTALFPPHVAEHQTRTLQEVFETGNSIYNEAKTVYPTGEIWIGTRLAPIRNAAGEVRAVLGIARDITERKQAEEQTQRQLQRLATLRTIDQAIAGSIDINFVLKVILDHVISQLAVDAVVILLYNPAAQTLEYSTGRGFRTEALQHTRLPLGEGYAGRAALGRQTVHIPDLQGRKTDFLRSPTFSQEGFVSYFGIPLIAKGEIRGVLEVFHRAAFEAESEWLNFLETLAGQTAIAIDNATLFKGLQLSNIELTMAYDATIEGWSRALDLRDKETEGHTQRVTEMSQHLARSMGINEAELVNMQRGALLHDIGKMGVPDAILLKAGPLTNKEWKIMRQHPQFAYDMLSPIEYLHSALDIPFCHHEKWDGTGYPRGLKGEEIPLAARIFAVIDVYDALTSDRPYRKAWTREKTLDYIREQAEKHFDPQVVEAFMEMLGTE